MLTIYYVSAKILLLKHIETKEKTFLILTAKKGTLTAKKTNQAIVRKITKEGKGKGQKENQKINHVSQTRAVIHSCFAERGGFEPPKRFRRLHAFQACLPYRISLVFSKFQKSKNHLRVICGF